MALDSLVMARYGGSSSQYLANLTRGFDPDGPGTVDTTVLGLACDDVKGDFEMEAGTVYDDDPTSNSTTYKSHRSVGVMCVVIKLQLWTGKLPDKVAIQLTKIYSELLVKLGKICGRDRFLVESSSPYEESDQTYPNGDPILPPFDPAIMDYFIPGATGITGGNNPPRTNQI